MQTKKKFLRLYFLMLITLLSYVSWNNLNAQTCITTNNIAFGKSVSAHHVESYAPAINITDGNLSTEWLYSVDAENWATIDLGASYSSNYLCKVIVKWPFASAVSNF